MDRQLRVLMVFGLLAVSLLAGGVLAASPDAYDLSWHVVAGGGGRSSSAAYALHGTAGQPAAGGLAGGGYVLGSGFWGGGEVVHGTLRIYLPVVLRHH